MKVRVSYATELGDITNKMSELIGQNTASAEELASLIKLATLALELDGADSVEYVYQIIDKVRKKMTSIDESLADVSGLMQGYIKNVLRPEPAPAPAPNIHEHKPQYVPPQEPVDDSLSESE